MGTFFTFTIASALDSATVDAACQAAFDEIARIEAMMSTFRENSPLSKLNQAAGKAAVKVPEELIRVIERSIEISKKTHGKFDVTFGAIGKLWNFHQYPPQIPDKRQIKERLPLLNYRLITINKNKGTVRLEKEGMTIGLGAIAKGYGVDRAASVLRSEGINDFIVYGGGDIYLSGTKGGKPWRVGIQDPRDRHRYFADFDVPDGGAVVTSGDYEKFFVVDGKRYHHIIDPATGYPAEGAVSVTVVAKNAQDADAFATSIFVLGPKDGMSLIESDPSLEGVIVDKDLKVHVSSGLKKRIELSPVTHPSEEKNE